MIPRLLVAMPLLAATAPAENTHLLTHDGLAVTIVTDSDRLSTTFGPRFDRTAFVSSARLHGVEFLHVHGLCDEFGLRGYGVIGYDDARPGETFIKPGVGQLIRADSEPYFFGRRYAVEALFPVDVEATADELTVRQHVPGHYVYTKRYRLRAGPTLEIAYTLMNLGASTWPVETYNHNWFAFSGVAATTAYTLETSFDLPGGTPAAYRREGRAIRLNQVPQGRGVNWAVELESIAGHHRAVLATPDSRQVRIEGDFPPARFALWGNDAAICPEFFLRVRLDPQETFSWTRRYIFSSPH